MFQSAQLEAAFLQLINHKTSQQATLTNAMGGQVEEGKRRQRVKKTVRWADEIAEVRYYTKADYERIAHHTTSNSPPLASDADLYGDAPTLPYGALDAYERDILSQFPSPPDTLPAPPQCPFFAMPEHSDYFPPFPSPLAINSLATIREDTTSDKAEEYSDVTTERSRLLKGLEEDLERTRRNRRQRERRRTERRNTPTTAEDSRRNKFARKPRSSKESDE